MGQEMRTPRLLTQRERETNKDARGQRPARAPARAVAEQEIAEQQRESRCRMRARKALGVRQGIGPVGEQPDVRPVSAEAGEVPGTIDVGHGLQSTDHARREHQCQERERRGPPPVPQLRLQQRSTPDDQRRGRDRPNQPATTGVQHVACPPGSARPTQPETRSRIVEQDLRDSAIQVERRDRRERGGKDDRGPKRMRRPAAAHASHNGKKVQIHFPEDVENRSVSSCLSSCPRKHVDVVRRRPGADSVARPLTHRHHMACTAPAPQPEDWAPCGAAPARPRPPRALPSPT